MLGRFLEFSIATPDILASYEFYRGLGFTGIDASDIYAHRYGVVTDGRIALGLHEADLPDLSLTYVHPELASHARALRDAGLAPAYERLSDERFHEIGFEDADGVPLRLLEARTFSPVDRVRVTRAGWFDDLLIPSRDVDASVAHWERLGFIRLGEDPLQATLTSDSLSLTIRSGLRTARPALHFTVDDLESARTALTAAGVVADQKLAVALGAPNGLAIVAPEGTTLVLTSPDA